MTTAAKGAIRVSRNELSALPVPMRTESHQPIPHNVFIDTVEEALSFRHIQITDADYVVSEDGMKLFSTLQVNAEYEGVKFLIGCRNSNDKSFRIGMVSGYRVMVCSNLAFSGDFNPLSAKHTKNFDLIESVSIGVDRIQRNWEPLRRQIDMKQSMLLSPDDVRMFIYRAFTEHKFPVSLFRQVTGAFENEPVHHSIWGVEQMFTHAFKGLNPISHYQATAKFGSLISRTVSQRNVLPVYPDDAEVP
jgi:hypothetical protein